MTILEPNTHPSASTASPSGGSHESPRYTAKDSLVYLRHLVEVLRDCAFDSLPDDDHPQSPHDELIHELADKLHEITKVVWAVSRNVDSSSVISELSGRPG